MIESCDDILPLTEYLILQNTTIIDEFLVDEINRACYVAINKSTGYIEDFTIVDKIITL